jgi:putative membrane protein insertion efficiency factor
MSEQEYSAGVIRENTETNHSPDHEPSLREMQFTVWNMPRMILMALIRGYQMTFSKMVPASTCRFHPTCSHYGYQAIAKHGVIKGSALAIWRVLRCNPLTPGGYDPVP